MDLNSAIRSEPSLLIVDDRPENLIAFEAVLAPLGHRLVKAMSGKEAVERVAKEDFALVLLDVHMPEMDGFATAARIQAHARCGRIPIVFITASNHDLEHVFKGYSHGAVDYLYKPIDPIVLRSKVAVFVELFQQSQRIKMQEALLRRRERERLEKINARSIAEREARYRSLVLASAQVVWSADPRGNMYADCSSWMAYTGQSAEEYRGLGWLEAVHPNDRENARQQWLAAVFRKEAFEMECRIRRDGGAYAFMSVRGVPVLDADGAVREWVGANTDITDRKTAEQEREGLLEREREALASARRAIRVRDEFLSIASHELNTPLSALKLQLGLQRRERDPVRLASRLGAIEQQVDRLSDLVTRLLDVSRFSSGDLALDPELLDLSAVIRDVAARFTAEAAAIGCELRVSSGAGAIAKLDRMRVEQVLSNLVSNALKYGKGKPVDLSLDVSDGIAQVSVRDRGIGIEPQSQDRIFERFERAESARGFGGFGLGLWIVRQIVDASGGRIAVESRPGAGSTFRVELPLHHPNGVV